MLRILPDSVCAFAHTILDAFNIPTQPIESDIWFGCHHCGYEGMRPMFSPRQRCPRCRKDIIRSWDDDDSILYLNNTLIQAHLP